MEALLLVLLIIMILLVYVYFRPSILHAKNHDFRLKNQESHDRIDARFHHKYIDAGNVRWHYVDEGDPKGETVLLVHGLPENWYAWDKIIPLIDKRYRVIAVDMKGYGRSIAADDNYDWHYVSDQMLSLMDELHIAKFHLVGHDWGAIITSVMTSDHPERILSFTRMEADLFPPDEKTSTYKKKPQWLLFENLAIGQLLMSNASWFVRLCYSKKRMKTKLSERDMNYFIYEFGRPGNATAAARYFLMKNRDMKALFDSIAYNTFPFPVVQLQADSDPSQPKALFEKIPNVCKNVRLVWIKDAGHFSTQDQPVQIAEAINELINSVPTEKKT